VTAVLTKPPTEVFGRPLRHFAHRADVLRLLALRRQGGIYLDMDTLCLKPFSDLLEYPCVRGRPGLCNAVILSEPGGRFISAWLASYRQFGGEKGTGPWQCSLTTTRLRPSPPPSASTTGKA